ARAREAARTVEDGRDAGRARELDPGAERALRRLRPRRADDAEAQLRARGAAAAVRDCEVDRRALLRQDETRRAGDGAGGAGAAGRDGAGVEPCRLERGRRVLGREPDERW